MKILISAFLFLTYTTIASGQKPVTHTENTRYGIYLSFEEFQHNSPSITAEFKPVYRGNYYGYPPTRLKVKNQKGGYDEIEKPVWGYYDSTSFYCFRKGFNKLEKFGRYCVFEGIKKALPEVGIIDKSINMIDANIKYLDYILDPYSGQIVKATRSSILEILRDDPELYAEFKKNGNKGDVYIFIERYNKKHPITYPIPTNPTAHGSKQRH